MDPDHKNAIQQGLKLTPFYQFRRVASHDLLEDHVSPQWRQELGKSDQEPEILKQKLLMNVNLVREMGMPPGERFQLWGIASGARAAMEKEINFYRTCKEQLASNPAIITNAIPRDVRRTLEHPRLQTEAGLRSLECVLSVFCHRNPQITYGSELNSLAAMLLVVYDGHEELAFWTLQCICNDILPPDYFTANGVGEKVDCEVLKQLTLKYMPELHATLANFDIKYEMLGIPWFMGMFVRSFTSLEDAMLVWDWLFVEGSAVLILVGLSVLKMFEDLIIRLDDHTELVSFLNQITRKVSSVSELLTMSFSCTCQTITKLQVAARKKLLAHKVHGHTRSENDRDVSIVGGVKNKMASLFEQKKQLSDDDVWVQLIREGMGNKTPTADEQHPLIPKLKAHVELIRKVGMPPSQRPLFWGLLSGALSAMTSNVKYYETCVEQLQTKQTKSYKDIEKDVKRTMGDVSWYQSKQGLDAMTRCLCVFSFRIPNIGYCQSMSDLAGALLLVYIEHEEAAFWTLETLITKWLPADYYSRSMAGVKADCEVLGKFASKLMPDLSSHLTGKGVSIDMITISWLMCMYLHIFSDLEMTMRVWDVFWVEGHSILIRVGLALLKTFEVKLTAIKETADLFVYLQTLGKQVQDITAILVLAKTFDAEVNEKTLAKPRAVAKKKYDEEFIKQSSFLAPNSPASKASKPLEPPSKAAHTSTTKPLEKGVN